MEFQFSRYPVYRFPVVVVSAAVVEVVIEFPSIQLGSSNCDKRSRTGGTGYDTEHEHEYKCDNEHGHDNDHKPRVVTSACCVGYVFEYELPLACAWVLREGAAIMTRLISCTRSCGTYGFWMNP